jgi:hypothetical protein
MVCDESLMQGMQLFNFSGLLPASCLAVAMTAAATNS